MGSFQQQSVIDAFLENIVEDEERQTKVDQQWLQLGSSNVQQNQVSVSDCSLVACSVDNCFACQPAVRPPGLTVVQPNVETMVPNSSTVELSNITQQQQQQTNSNIFLDENAEDLLGESTLNPHIYVPQSSMRTYLQQQQQHSGISNISKRIQNTTNGLKSKLKNFGLPLGESSRQNRQRELLNQHMRAQSFDNDVQMQQQSQQQQNSSSSNNNINTSSTESSIDINNALPGSLPVFYNNVEDLVQSMDNLTVTGVEQGSLRLSFDNQLQQQQQQLLQQQHQQQQAYQQHHSAIVGSYGATNSAQWYNMQAVGSFPVEFGSLSQPASASTSTFGGSGVDPLFGVDLTQGFGVQGSFSNVDNVGNIGSGQNVGESGGTGLRGSGMGAGGQQGGGGGGGHVSTLTGPTLQPNFVKIDRPSTFNGKHSDLKDFIFQMKSYMSSTNMAEHTACRFLASFLKGDALAWWRTYCEERGGVEQVFNNIDLDTMFDCLTEQFSDVDEAMRVRCKLFAIRQQTSVQAYTSEFRKLRVALGKGGITDQTAMHIYLFGLKYAVRESVLKQRPDTFEAMVLDAERADQAIMMTRQTPSGKHTGGSGNNRGGFQGSSGGNQRDFGGNGRVFGSGQRGGFQGKQWGSFGGFKGSGSFGNFGGRSGGGNSGNSGNGGNKHVGFGGVSQYGNHPYKGPAPMVLGAAQSSITCYECGQPGHIRRNCPKLKGGRAQAAGGKQLNNLDVSADLANILNLGMMAAQNQERQRQQAASGSGSTGGQYGAGSGDSGIDFGSGFGKGKQPKN